MLEYVVLHHYLDVGRAELDLHEVLQTTKDVAHSQRLHPGSIGFRVRGHRNNIFLSGVPERPGHWVQRQVGSRHAEIILRAIGDRHVADHAETRDNVMYDPFKESFRRSLDFSRG